MWILRRFGVSAFDSELNRADLVTEMRAVKHYFDAGIPACDGIEKLGRSDSIIAAAVS